MKNLRRQWFEKIKDWTKKTIVEKLNEVKIAKEKKMMLKIWKKEICKIYCKASIIIVRTRIDLNPKQEWIQAHVAQTMNL